MNIWKEAEAGINVEKHQKVSVIFLIVIFPLRLSKASMYGVDVVEQLIDPEAIEPIILIEKGQYDSSDVVHLVNYHHHFAPLLDSKILQENELTAHFNEKFQQFSNKENDLSIAAFHLEQALPTLQAYADNN